MLPAAPGAPPSDDQVLAAVSAYLTANPASGASSTTIRESLDTTAELTLFGSGAGGAAGSAVGIGSHDSLAGYVVASGSMPDVDLHLVPQGAGSVFLDQDVLVRGNVLVDSAVTLASAVSLAVCDTGLPGLAVMDAAGLSYTGVCAASFTVTSDVRLKSEIVPLAGALAEVRTTPAYSYVMGGERRRGLLAQESPAGLVRADSRGVQLLDLYDLVGTLWAAVHELAQEQP